MEIFSLYPRGQFLKLLHPAPNFLSSFSVEEVELQKHFLALNFFSRKSSQKVGRRGAIVERNFQEIEPRAKLKMCRFGPFLSA